MGRSTRKWTEGKIPVTVPDPAKEGGYSLAGDAVIIEKGGKTEIRITLPAESGATEALTQLAKEGQLLGVGFYYSKTEKAEESADIQNEETVNV